jgi:hypothetical protein
MRTLAGNFDDFAYIQAAFPLAGMVWNTVWQHAFLLRCVSASAFSEVEDNKRNFDYSVSRKFNSFGMTIDVKKEKFF